ncbi:MAG: hypothetical protein ABIA77_05425 [Candidatus Omnitrophota bacterium]
MENDKKRSSFEVKKMILSELKDVGYSTELVDIRVVKGKKVILSGEVLSPYEKNILVNTASSVVGSDNVIDETVIMDNACDEYEDDSLLKNNELRDEDEDFIGTEDIFRSIEDGIPYIPPTSSPSRRRSSGPSNGNRRKRKP